MSLINQMLKDLESRREGDEADRHLIDSLGRSHRRRNHNRLYTVLSLLLIAVIAGGGYSLWQRQAPTTSQAKPTTASEPTVTPSEKQAPTATRQSAETTASMTENMATNAEADAATEPSEPTPTTQTKPTSVVTQTSGPAPTPTKPEPKQAKSKIVTAAEPEAVTPIEKRIRPLSAGQRAEKRYQAGYSLLQQGNQKAAEEQWLEALRLDPTHSAAREAIAALYLSQVRRVEAAEQLRQGLAATPGNGQFALLLARLRLEDGDTNAAAAALEAALKEQAQSADFYAFLAAVYQRQRVYAKSIEAYRRALRMQPERAVWWMGIAISLEGAGKPNEALSAYKKALASDRLTAQLREYTEGRINALE